MALMHAWIWQSPLGNMDSAPHGLAGLNPTIPALLVGMVGKYTHAVKVREFLADIGSEVVMRLDEPSKLATY